MGKRKVGLQSALSQAQDRQQQEIKRQKREKEQERWAKSKRTGQSADASKASSSSSAKPWRPFSSQQRILLVGEGNFSFAASLVQHVVPQVGARLCATAYDSEEVAAQKYPDLQQHLTVVRQFPSLLRDAGAQVLFGVDGTALHRTKHLKTLKHHFDRIVFLYPHVGLGEKDEQRNVRLNQTLLLGFFKSAAELLAEGSIPNTGSRSAKRKAKSEETDQDEEDDLLSAFDEEEGLDVGQDRDAERGSILVVLREGKPYSLWAVGALAKQGPMLASSLKLPGLKPNEQPTYIQVRSGEFNPEWYPGYAHRRTLGFDERHSTTANEDTQLSARDRKKASADRHGDKVKSRMWQFCLTDQ